MKKTISIIFLALTFALSLVAPVQAAECSAKAMILYEPRTGTVLSELNADARMLVASTTKIMTALVVLERCALGDTVCVTAEQASVEGSTAHLRAGENYTVEELLCGLMLVSGNDAATALAEHTAGSVDAFAALMNEKCGELGLKNSHFVNPHGLDDPEHYSSARDLALITAAAMENEAFCRLFAMESCTVRGIRYRNHNKLLQTCEGCIGGKTGYTKAAGRVLVSCVERDGLRLICVTISAPNDWDEHCSAYTEAFSNWKYVSLPGAERMRMEVISGTVTNVPLYCTCPGIVLPADTSVELITELPRFAFAPLAEGSVLGRVTVLADGQEVLKMQILCGGTVELDSSVPLTHREKFRRGWDMYCRYGIYSGFPMVY